MHFYFFHENLLNDSVFFTNFLQIVGGVKADFDKNNNLKINYDELQPYSLEDMFSNDPYQLFSVCLLIFQ